MEFVSTELEPPDHVITGLDEHVSFDNLNGQYSVSIKIRVSDKILENEISVIEVENPYVSVGLSNVHLVRLRHGGADGVDSFGEALGSVDVDGLDDFRRALSTGALLVAGQVGFPESNVAIVAARYSVHDIFQVD